MAAGAAGPPQSHPAKANKEGKMNNAEGAESRSGGHLSSRHAVKAGNAAFRD
jgi:hypothetical protein